MSPSLTLAHEAFIGSMCSLLKWPHGLHDSESFLLKLQTMVAEMSCSIHRLNQKVFMLLGFAICLDRYMANNYAHASGCKVL